MTVSDEEARIEDELEILSTFCKIRQIRCLLSWGNLDLKKIESRKGPFIEVVDESVIFPTSLTPSNVEFWNSRYR